MEAKRESKKEGGREGGKGSASERENRVSREAWRTGEPTPGGSQSINSLTRSPTKRDLLLSLRSQCDYIYRQPGSLHYVRPLGCLQPFCNRSPCTVSLESLSSHPLSKTRDRERQRPRNRESTRPRSTITSERRSARSKEFRTSDSKRPSIEI